MMLGEWPFIQVHKYEFYELEFFLEKPIVQTFFSIPIKWNMIDEKYCGVQMHYFPKSFDCHCTSEEKHLLLFPSGLLDSTTQHKYFWRKTNTAPSGKISENQCIFKFSTYLMIKYTITRLLTCLSGSLLKTRVPTTTSTG